MMTWAKEGFEMDIQDVRRKYWSLSADQRRVVRHVHALMASDLDSVEAASLLASRRAGVLEAIAATISREEANGWQMLKPAKVGVDHAARGGDSTALVTVQCTGAGTSATGTVAGRVVAFPPVITGTVVLAEPLPEPLRAGQTRRMLFVGLGQSDWREFDVLDRVEALLTIKWRDTRVTETVKAATAGEYVSGPTTDAEELEAGTRLWLERVPEWTTRTAWLRTVMDIHERVTATVRYRERTGRRGMGVIQGRLGQYGAYAMFRHLCVDEARQR